MKSGRLSNEEKSQILSKVGNEAALKRLAKKLDRSYDTLVKFLDSQKSEVEVAPEPVVEAPKQNPVDKPAFVDMWGNPKAAPKEAGVVVATERSSGRVDAINKKLGHNTVEGIVKRRPDCTSRIR